MNEPTEDENYIDDLSTRVAQAILAFHSVVADDWEAESLCEYQVADIVRCVISPETCVRDPLIPLKHAFKPGILKMFKELCKEENRS